MTSQQTHPINLDCQVRFAHIDGHTDVALIPGRRQIVTAGVDCEIRIWSADPADDGVKSSFNSEDVPYALACTNDRVYVALGSNCVKAYLLEDGEAEAPVCRFTANATCLALHSNGELLAAGAADFTIKLVNLVDQTMKAFEGHQGPVLSVAIDPLRKYLASSATDGAVFLWAIDSKTVHHKWSQLFKSSNDFETSLVLCRIAWHPNGEYLAIPRSDRVSLYKRGQWDNSAVDLVHASLQHFSLVCFSPDGRYVAAATGGDADTKSAVAVWLLDQPDAAHSLLTEVERRFTSIIFHPTDSKQLFAMDRAGMLHIMTVLRDNMQPVTAIGKPDQLFTDIDMDDDLILENEPVEKVTSNNPPDNLGNLEESAPDEFDIGAIKSRYEPFIFGDDDNGQSNQQRRANQTAGSVPTTDELVVDGQRISGRQLLELINGPRYKPPLRQAPFQSGSTPTHYQHRFMVWNGTGIVYGHQSDDERSIDVEFHDSSFHQSIHMANMYNYSMADLSPACLLLASNGDDCDAYDDGQLKSRLFCLMFGAWDSIKEWQTDLPKGERFECIAAGQCFVAAMTSERYLRVWTVGGVQTMIRSIEGAAINLSAFNDRLMALFHLSSHHPDDGQAVAALVLKVDHTGRTRNHIMPNPTPVALAPRSTVYWAGFSDEGTPSIVDSDGIVRMWKTCFGHGWFPMLATKQHANGRSDNFFVVGLSELQGQVRCIFCKASRYPDTVPKPTLTVLPFKIPLCEVDPVSGSDIKSKNEEECLRNRWLLFSARRLTLEDIEVRQALTKMTEGQKRIINSLIKLFALALGAERESLAFEIAKLLPSSEALKGAVKYAQQKKHRSLASKLVQLLNIGVPGEETEEEDNCDVELITLADRISTGRPSFNEHLLSPPPSLKPKARKPKKTPLKSPPKSSSATMVIELDDDDSSQPKAVPGSSRTLRPKPVATTGTPRNPFKASGSKQNKRQRFSSSGEQEGQDGDDEEELHPNDIHGFDCFLEANRLRFCNQMAANGASFVSGSSVTVHAEKMYAKLSKKEKAVWEKKAKAARLKESQQTAKNAASGDTGKITKFFDKK